MAFSINMGVLSLGVLVIGALPFGVCIRAPDFFGNSESIASGSDPNLRFLV